MRIRRSSPPESAVRILSRENEIPPALASAGLKSQTIMPDLNALLVEAQLTRFIERHAGRLAGDDRQKRATAFLLISMKRIFNLSDDEAFDLLAFDPQGAQGQGIGPDAIHIGDVVDNAFVVTLFWARFCDVEREEPSDERPADPKDEANDAFHDEAIVAACAWVRGLLEGRTQEAVARRLAAAMAQVQSLAADGIVPYVRAYLCGNGGTWLKASEERIDALEAAFAPQVEFRHFSQADLIRLLGRNDAPDACLQLQGKALSEDHDHARVLVGRMHVRELLALFHRCGDQLPERAARAGELPFEAHEQRALGAMLASGEARHVFGCCGPVTIVCERFSWNALEACNHVVKVRRLEIAGGGAVCRAVVAALKDVSEAEMPEASLMVRIIEVDDDREGFMRAAAILGGTSDPCVQAQLRADDPVQKRLAADFVELGIAYAPVRPSRFDDPKTPKTLAGSLVAEAVLSVWRERPHQATFMRREHFGKLYGLIFANLNAAQARLAVAVFQEAEARRRASSADAPAFLPYASHFIAMLMGRRLLEAGGLEGAAQIDGQNVGPLLARFEKQKDGLYADAISDLDSALTLCLGKRAISLQQLAATFRRGDLLAVLQEAVRRPG